MNSAQCVGGLTGWGAREPGSPVSIVETDTRGGLPLLVKAGKDIRNLCPGGREIAGIMGRHLHAAWRVTQLHDSV